MSTVTITVTIDVPEGAALHVGQSASQTIASHTNAPLTAIESESGWVCPEHGGARVVPAGVSKKTGKPYSAFRVCVRQECEQKEPLSR
jgi:hypothetical protein